MHIFEKNHVTFPAWSIVRYSIVRVKSLNCKQSTLKGHLIKKIILMVGIIAVLGVATSPIVLSSPTYAQNIPSRYIIVFNDVDEPRAVANEMASEHGLSVIHVYKYALKGFNAIIPNVKLEQVKNDPRVSYVEKDQKVFAFDKPPHSHSTDSDSVQSSLQVIPTGVERINADLSSTEAGNGSGIVDVDIAIIDTGLDTKHPDLNVYKHARCTGTGPNKDQNGHGTHVAGTAAALDNEEGVVGVAPGARLWGVKVLDATGSGTLGCVIAGIDYVTSHAAEIEVANMSLGFRGTSTALDEAIETSVAAGVVYVVAAGNSAEDAVAFSPANHPNVITVSAIADFNGQPGGSAQSTCLNEIDDTFAYFSNFGDLIELAAPGVCIYSTWLNGGYNTISGTSMSSPHVAGAAALYIANNPNALPADVLNALIAAGTPQDDPDGFTEDTDGYPEQLLNTETL